MILAAIREFFNRRRGAPKEESPWMRHFYAIAQAHPIVAEGLAELGKDVPDPLSPAQVATLVVTLCQAETRSAVREALLRPELGHLVHELVEQILADRLAQPEQQAGRAST
jgi:hypothetical protein